MLTDVQRTIIKATVPLLESGGEALTRHFYKILLGDFPEVRPMFNQAHQASGDQQRALANSVLMYAKHIDRLEGLGDLPVQIVQKHTAFSCRVHDWTQADDYDARLSQWRAQDLETGFDLSVAPLMRVLAQGRCRRRYRAPRVR